MLCKIIGFSSAKTPIDMQLDALEEQINLLGYRPRHIEYPKTEAERKENASGIFMSSLNSGNTKLKDYQRQRYEKMLDGVPEYREWETNNHLYALAKQINLLGYRPRHIEYPKTEAERKEKASCMFMDSVERGYTKLKDYQWRIYKQILAGVPEYREYITEKNLCSLESFILGHEHRPSGSVWASEEEERSVWDREEEKRLAHFFNHVIYGIIRLSSSQQKRFDAIKDAPTMRQYCKEHDLPWR